MPKLKKIQKSPNYGIQNKVVLYKIQHLQGIISWAQKYADLISAHCRRYRGTNKNNPKKCGRKVINKEVKVFQMILVMIYYDWTSQELFDAIHTDIALQAIFGLGNNLDKDGYIIGCPKPSTIDRYLTLFSKGELTDILFKRDTADISQQIRQYLIKKGNPAAYSVLYTGNVDSTIEETYISRKPKQRGVNNSNELPPDQEGQPLASRHRPTGTWTVKRGVSYCGYKRHVIADAITNIVCAVRITPAHVHDIKALIPLMDSCVGKPLVIYGDKGYFGEAYRQELAARGVELKALHPKNKAVKKLSQEEQNQVKLENNKKSRIRCRVEHIFNHHKNRKRLRLVLPEKIKTWLILEQILSNRKRRNSIIQGKVLIRTESQMLSDIECSAENNS